jgi:hypothetical protein
MGEISTREHFDNATDLLPSGCEVITVNPDKPFDQYLRGYLSQKESERFSSDPP